MKVRLYLDGFFLFRRIGGGEQIRKVVFLVVFLVRFFFGFFEGYLFLELVLKIYRGFFDIGNGRVQGQIVLRYSQIYIFDFIRLGFFLYLVLLFFSLVLFLSKFLGGDQMVIINFSFKFCFGYGVDVLFILWVMLLVIMRSGWQSRGGLCLF